MRSEQFIDKLNDAVRENPAAAGLIGIGLAWMVFGRTSAFMRETAGAAHAAKASVDTAVDAATGAIGSTMTDAADRVRQTTTAIGEAVSDKVKVAAAKVSGAAETGSQTATTLADKESAGGGRRALSYGKGFADLLERQPLALAAVGIGIGAALASAFPLTRVEGRFMGTAGGKLKETVTDAADTVVDRAASAIGEATDEAVAQRLTPDAVKDAVKTGAAKLKRVAETGLETMER
jgi:hypothetical protein